MEIEELLRDESSTWNVPLLQYLDSYMKRVLEPVDDLTSNDLNFVSAGMILERTTSVFSNKVRKLLKIAYGSKDEEQKECRKRVERAWVSDGCLVDFDIDFEETCCFCSEEPNIEVSTVRNTPWELRFDGQHQFLVHNAPDPATGAIVLVEKKIQDCHVSVNSSPLAFVDGRESVTIEAPLFELSFEPEEEMFPMLDPDERHPELEKPFQKMKFMRIPHSFKSRDSAKVIQHVNPKVSFITTILKSLATRQNSGHEQESEWEFSEGNDVMLPDAPVAPVTEDYQSDKTERDIIYEEACRSSVQTIIDDGKKSVRNCERAEHLAEWEQEMESLFAKEYSAFDIAHYKEKVLERLRNNNGTSSFKCLTQHHLRHDVSRTLLTLLVLANEELITIADECEGDFRVILHKTN